MLWYMNPHNETQAIDLSKIVCIELGSCVILFDDKILWEFVSHKKAKDIYESMIKLLQEKRYK